MLTRARPGRQGREIKGTMTLNPVSLDDLRREIDEIDRQLHDLLMRRGGLAHKIAAVKGPDGPYWRPAREAAVVRRLVARHTGEFPPETVLRVWRQIMTATVALEGRISVAALLSPDEPQLWDLARDHFGAIPVTGHKSVGAVLKAATESQTVIGVLPPPREEDADPWWRFLVTGGPDAPRVVVRLPFAGGAPQRGALLVGRIPVEPSGDDRSLLAVETLSEISRARVAERLAGIGIEGAVIAVYPEPGRQPVRLNLVEAAGFIGLDDPRLAALGGTEPGTFGRVVALGAYATPLA